MKAYLLGFVCLILWGLARPTRQAPHQGSLKHGGKMAKDHHPSDKATTAEKGALKNIILHKSQSQQIKENQTSSANTPILPAATETQGSQPAPKTGLPVQATGRAILVQNANNGVGQVVQAGSANGKSPVIVINSEAPGNKGALDPFSQDCLDAHNTYRAKHGVPPLMWSHDLAEGAQTWADQLASTDSLQHDQVAIQNRKIGENLAYFQPPVPKCEGAMVDNCVNCREMVQRWYDEVKNYDFDKGGPKSRSGPYKHFSQMIWANSAELGVGTAVSKRYGFITVARYRPTGNEGGFAEFIKNVPPEGGPLPTMTPPLKDNKSPKVVVKKPGLTQDSAVVSSAAVTLLKPATTTPLKDTKQDAPEITSAITQIGEPLISVPAKATDTVTPPSAHKGSTENVEKQPSKQATAIVTPSASHKDNTENVVKQPSKQATDTVTTPAPQNQSTKNAVKQPVAMPNQPITANQTAHAKGGFVHTLTATDGTKAQVYLSKNGAHAGIVFRNEISRAPLEGEVKRAIYVL